MVTKWRKSKMLRLTALWILLQIWVIDTTEKADKTTRLSSSVESRNQYILDIEARVNVTQLITSKGFPCEDYVVQTQDGFLLSVQRIPHGRDHPRSHAQPRPVVFLQHGLLCSSANWLTNLANQSLGFVLADAGYDVWLGNFRGNTYSRRHVNLSPDSDQFWAWSIDELAQYDLPAMINFVLNKTGRSQLYYAGHSQGTTVAFAQLSRDPILAKKVRMFFALGPVTTIGEVHTPLRFLAYLTPELEAVFKLLGVREFLPNHELGKFIAQTVCKEKLTRGLCANIFFLLSGYDSKQLNFSRLPVYTSHTPAGTSVRNIVHYTQMFMTSRFQMYDFGDEKENLRHYGQVYPPLYREENMSTPTVLIWSHNDWLVGVKDIARLKSKLQNLVTEINIPEYNHLDFIWAMDAAKKVYTKMISIIEKDYHRH